MSVEVFREKLAFIIIKLAFVVAPQPLRKVLQLSLSSGLSVIKGAYEQAAKQIEVKKEVQNDNIILH